MDWKEYLWLNAKLKNLKIFSKLPGDHCATGCESCDESQNTIKPEPWSKRCSNAWNQLNKNGQHQWCTSSISIDKEKEQHINWIANSLFSWQFSSAYLSASVPKTIFPTKMPNIKIVCDVCARNCRSHTKFHVIWMVSVKILWSNSYDVHWAEHGSVIFGSAHEYLMFGAANIMLIWCHATGNFNKKINAQMIACHRPNEPMACWIGSDFGGSGFFSLLPLLSVLPATVPKLLAPLASTSIAAIETKYQQ